MGTPAAGTPAPSGMTPPVPPGTNTPHPTFAPSRPLQHPTHSGPQHPTHSGPQPSGVTGRYTSPPPGSPASGPPGGPGGITGYTTTAHPQPPQPPVGPAPHTQRFTHPHGGTGRGNTQQNPWSSRALPNMPKPVPVVIAAIMLGINALYLMVLTALLATDALTSGTTGWGPTLFLGAWGLVSACAAVGLMARSRILYALVLVMQGIGAVVLTFSMFTVFIYNPEQIVLYGLVLIFNLAIGALLLFPGRAREFFGFGFG